MISASIFKTPVLGQIYQKNFWAIKRSYWKFLRSTGIRPGPYEVQWLTTYRCNSDCAYCEASANEGKGEELTTEQIKSVLDELKILRVKELFISGGEPLLRADLFEVIDYAHKLGLSIAMITNSLLYEKYKEEIKNARIKYIWTSVDGLCRTHDTNRGHPGAYEKTLDAVRYYTQINIPFRVVNTLVHPGNYDELPELFNELKKAGITRWRLALAISVGRAKENKWFLSPDKIQKLFQYVEEIRRDFNVDFSEELGYLGCWDTKLKDFPFICPAGQNYCVILPYGDVLPCQIVYDTKYSEGNIKEKSFKEIWEQGFKRFRSGELEGECRDCIHEKGCQGGCWGRMLLEGKCLRHVWDPKNYGE